MSVCCVCQYYAAEHSLLYCAGWNTVFHSVSTRWEDCVLHSHHQSSVCSNTKRETLFLFLFFLLFAANQKSDPLLPCPLVTHALTLCNILCGCPLWLMHWRGHSQLPQMFHTVWTALMKIFLWLQNIYNILGACWSCIVSSLYLDYHDTKMSSKFEFVFCRLNCEVPNVCFYLGSDVFIKYDPSFLTVDIDTARH